eukprot:4578036-Pyramimonas_sp.AAC.1
MKFGSGARNPIPSLAFNASHPPSHPTACHACIAVGGRLRESPSPPALTCTCSSNRCSVAWALPSLQRRNGKKRLSRSAQSGLRLGVHARTAGLNGTPVARHTRDPELLLICCPPARC